MSKLQINFAKAFSPHQNSVFVIGSYKKWMIKMLHERTGTAKAGSLPSMASGLAPSLGVSSRTRLWCPGLSWVVLLCRSDADNDSETGHQRWHWEEVSAYKNSVNGLYVGGCCHWWHQPLTGLFSQEPICSVIHSVLRSAFHKRSSICLTVSSNSWNVILRYDGNKQFFLLYKNGFIFYFICRLCLW